MDDFLIRNSCTRFMLNEIESVHQRIISSFPVLITYLSISIHPGLQHIYIETPPSYIIGVDSGYISSNNVDQSNSKNSLSGTTSRQHVEDYRTYNICIHKLCNDITKREWDSPTNLTPSSIKCRKVTRFTTQLLIARDFIVELSLFCTVNIFILHAHTHTPLQ